MTTSSNKDQYVIGPRWDHVLISMFFTGVLVLFHIYNVSGHIMHHRYPLVYLPIVLAVLLFSCQCYIVDHSGLTVSFFGIPIRRLPWGTICQVILIRKWASKKGMMEGMFLITLWGQNPFCVGLDEVEKYTSEHRFKCVTIQYPKKKLDECIAAFEKYRGAIIDIEQA